MRVYTYGALTDRGDSRPENQDSILCLTGMQGDSPAALFIVADGMGGLDQGAQASRWITERFAKWWEEDFPAMIQAGRTSEEDIRELLEQEIWDINQEILEYRRKEQCRCGSTLSLLLIYEDRYFVENLGDSRIYLLRHGRLRQITQDQSLVAQLVREGKMTADEARQSRQKNKLTMCVGMFEIPQSFSDIGTVAEGDQFLLCSDGLYNFLDPEQIQLVLSHRELDGQRRAQMLRVSIPPGQGKDNVSVILAEISP